MEFKQYIVIVAMGVIAIILIIVGGASGVPDHVSRGLTFSGLGVLLFLASSGAWSSDWLVGLILLVAGLVFLGLGIIAF